MVKVVLCRIGEYDNQTYGVLSIAGRPRFVTCEDIWKNNERNISCIPPGKYTCKHYDSPTFGFTYLVESVPDRSGILFHPGNDHTDTRGCILVGSSFSPDASHFGIVQSRVAFGQFLNLLKDVTSFELTVRNYALLP